MKLSKQKKVAKHSGKKKSISISKKKWVILGATSLILLSVVGISSLLLRNQQQSSPDHSVLGTVVASVQPPKEGLISNEYSYYNPQMKDTAKSSDWEVSSGSLFGKDGTFWTGKPDSCAPDKNSRRCTNSDVFRINTKRSFSSNTRVSFAIKQNKEIHSRSCERQGSCWHGTHIWLRYQNQYNLYYASINRADGRMVIKRKVPCGNDNRGTYFNISPYKKFDFKTGEWHRYSVTVASDGDGSVVVRIFDDQGNPQAPILTGVDKGGTNPNWSPRCNVPGKYDSAKYLPIRAAGPVGIRGDYANFSFKDFKVTKF